MSLPIRSHYKDTGAVWVSAYHGEVPPNAVHGGNEANGEPLYVARFVTKEGQLAPGKLAASHRHAYASCGGKEHHSTSYQVLTHPNQAELRWVSVHNDELPTGALQAGGNHHSPLFIGRAQYEGGLCLGKFEPTHRCLYIPYGGKEHSISHCFEVLCLARIFE